MSQYFPTTQGYAPLEDTSYNPSKPGFNAYAQETHDDKNDNTKGANSKGSTNTKPDVGTGVKTQKSVRILRACQGLLSSSLSICIAVIQTKVYVTFIRTQHTQGAWPQFPQLLPTILLFSVSAAAAFFDMCLLIGYIAPGKGWRLNAFVLANYLYAFVSAAKLFSYSISSAVFKQGFNYGNNSGANTDLWSWTCTDQAAQHDNITQAESNCATQQFASYFAFANIGIEVLSGLIGLLLSMDTIKQQLAVNKRIESEKDKAGVLDMYGASLGAELQQVTPGMHNTINL